MSTKSTSTKSTKSTKQATQVTPAPGAPAPVAPAPVETEATPSFDEKANLLFEKMQEAGFVLPDEEHNHIKELLVESGLDSDAPVPSEIPDTLPKDAKETWTNYNLYCAIRRDQLKAAGSKTGSKDQATKEWKAMKESQKNVYRQMLLKAFSGGEKKGHAHINGYNLFIKENTDAYMAQHNGNYPLAVHAMAAEWKVLKTNGGDKDYNERAKEIPVGLHKAKVAKIVTK